MTLNYILGKQLVSENEIKRLLIKNDKFFYPRLSSRVNIGQYSKKLYANAYFILCNTNDKSVVGLIAFYANDFETSVAYLSIIFVNQEYQGHGIAKNMIKMMFDKLKELNFIEILLEVHQENASAINMYENIGFTPIKSNGEFIIMEKSVYI
jgi:ribosomal protein S18 acetylase RimI-like enzyme